MHGAEPGRAVFNGYFQTSASASSRARWATCPSFSTKTLCRSIVLPRHITFKPVVCHLIALVVALVKPSLALAASERGVQVELPKQLQPAVSKLQSERASVRTTAVFRLAEAAPRFSQLQPLLVDTLGDDSVVPQWQHPEQPWVRRVTSPGREAARGLVRLEATEPLLEVLGSGSREARQNAAWALAELGEPQAVPVMLNRIWNPGFIPALGKLADRRGVGPLVQQLDGNRAFEAARALRAMGRVAEPKLIEALQQERGQIRNEVADILGRLESQAAGEALVEAAQAGSLEAGEALLRIDPVDGAAAMFMDKLDHDDWRWRRTALAGLIHGSAEVDSEVLLERLNDPDDTVRGYAARAAGELKAESVADAVAERLDDQSDFVRQSALAALAALGDPRATPAIDELLATGGKAEKRKAVDWLKGIGSEEAMSKLAGLLADREARSAARQALLEIGAPAIPHVRAWLIDTGRRKDISGNRIWRLAGVGCGVLGEFGEPALPALIALLDHDWRLQARAHKALQKITGRQFSGSWQQRTPKWKRWWRENQPSELDKFIDDLNGEKSVPHPPPPKPEL